MTARKTHRKSSPFSPGDFIRIPLGILFIYLSISAVIKAAAQLDQGWIALLIFILSIVVGIVFLAIGFVMAVVPFVDLIGSRRKPSSKNPKKKKESRD